MYVKPKDFSCCAGWDFVGPGTCKVARLDGNEGIKMHLAKLYIFYSSLFPFTFYIFVFTSDVPIVFPRRNQHAL